MQLSTSQFSSETNLAALLLGGLCPAGQSAAPDAIGAGLEAVDFAQFLPEAPAGALASAMPIGIGAGTPSVASAFAPFFSEGAVAAAPAPGAPIFVSSPEAEESLPTDTVGARAPLVSRERTKGRGVAPSPLPAQAQPMRKLSATETECAAVISPEALALMMPQPVQAPAAPVVIDPAADAMEEEVDLDTEANLSENSGSATSFLASRRGGSAMSEDRRNIAEQPTAFSSTEATDNDLPIATPGFSLRQAAVGSASVTPATEGIQSYDSAKTAVPLSTPVISDNPGQNEGGRPEVPVQMLAATPSRATTETALVERTANIAVRVEKNSGEKNSGILSAAKSFLNIGGKRLASHQPDFGIGVAEAASTSMSATTLSSRALSPLSGEEVPVTTAVESGKATPEFTTASTSGVSTAHRAVAEVLHVAERIDSREQSSVSIQFSIGGEDLSVRVEVRANEVHATFRTDSAELRAALSQEWQSVTHGGGERSMRLAAPVFAGTDANAFSSSSGDTASQQRDSGAHRTGHDPAIISARSLSGHSAAASTPAAPAPRVWSGNSLHLHTLA